MQEEIGSTADAIWYVPNTKGDLSLAELKKEINGKTPVLDWAGVDGSIALALTKSKHHPHTP